MIRIQAWPERPLGRRGRAVSMSAPMLALLVLAACEEDPGFAVREDEVCFERRDGVRVCIDVYEASRQDATATEEGVSDEPPRSTVARRPWVNITWSAAREACRAKGKRLCERDEWIDACDGGIGESEGQIYLYGETEDTTICNVDRPEGPVEGGSFMGCRSPLGTFDQAGNVWEWTGNRAQDGVARGGSFRSSQAHRCDSGDRLLRFPIEQPNVEVGFRCCREAS